VAAQRRCFAAFPFRESSASQDLTDLPPHFDLDQVKLVLVYQKLNNSRCADAGFAAFPFRESSASRDLTDSPAILTLSKSNWE
jgi:hypothetical protein